MVMDASKLKLEEYKAEETGEPRYSVGYTVNILSGHC